MFMASVCSAAACKEAGEEREVSESICKPLERRGLELGFSVAGSTSGFLDISDIILSARSDVTSRESSG